MPRIQVVKKARTEQGSCGRCGTTVKAGDPYRFIKFRYGGRRVRCMSNKCGFRASELTQSKLSGALAAYESAQESVEHWNGVEAEGDVGDLRSALEEAASEIRDVGQEYQDSAESMNQTAEGSSTAQECEEKAAALEEWADALESAAGDLDDFQGEDLEEEPGEKDGDEHKTWERARDERESALSGWAEEQKGLASEALSDCPV